MKTTPNNGWPVAQATDPVKQYPAAVDEPFKMDLDAKMIKKTGDTMTGSLSTPGLVVSATSGLVQFDGASNPGILWSVADRWLANYAGRVGLYIGSTGLRAPLVVGEPLQTTDAATKGYVDNGPPLISGTLRMTGAPGGNWTAGSTGWNRPPWTASNLTGGVASAPNGLRVPVDGLYIVSLTGFAFISGTPGARDIRIAWTTDNSEPLSTGNIKAGGGYSPMILASSDPALLTANTVVYPWIYQANTPVQMSDGTLKLVRIGRYT